MTAAAETNTAPQSTTPAKLKLVAVTSEVAAEAVGSIVYWKLASETDIGALTTEWEKAGLPKDLGKVPDPPTPEVALARTMAEQKEKRVLVRPLAKAKDGYAIVKETVEPGKDPVYETLCKVSLSASFKPVFDPPTYTGCETIREGYKKQLNTVVATDLSTWLAGLMTGPLEAVSLKTTGGVYFVPAHKAPLFRRVRKVVNTTSNVIHEIPAMDSEAATVAFVDALTAEAETAVATTMKELESAALGSRALQTRSKATEVLLAKIERYEKLLGTSLGAMKSKVEQLGGAVAAASLAASAD